MWDPVDATGIGESVDSLSPAAVSANERPVRISGEVAALLEDALEVVLLFVPKGVGGQSDDGQDRHDL